MEDLQKRIDELTKILNVLLSLEEQYGHLTMYNVISRFKADIKYLTELLNK